MNLSLVKICWVIGLLFSFGLVQAQTKRALVIGLGQQEDPSWGKINGDKDVPIVVDMLTNAGYGDNIITLINEQATKANIVSAFGKLALSCMDGDIVYIHFSGHGQQMKDFDTDEKDGLDECWISYDAYRKPSDIYKGEKHLTDDEVNVLLTDIRSRIGESGKILVVIDACHSGDGTRGNDDNDEVIRGVTDIFEVIANSVKKTLVKVPKIEKESTNDAQWISISACRSNQVNAELKIPAVGKLTYFMSQIIKEGKARTNKDIEKEIYWLVNSHSKKGAQTPEISGDDKSKYDIVDIIGSVDH